MPVKTEKPAAKLPIKVFDVAGPGKITPDATSRPIIVSNRSMMQDPMMTNSDSSESKPAVSRAAVKVTINPLQDSGDKEDKKTDPEAPTESETEETKQESSDVTAGETKLPEAETTPEPEEEKTPDAALEEEKETDKPAENPDSQNADAGVPLVGNKDAKEAAALEAAAKQKEELDKLVERRDYFLPINTVERRRSKIVTILGLLLIVLLGLLLFNMLLDVGFLRIEGVSPLTHFFSS